MNEIFGFYVKNGTDGQTNTRPMLFTLSCTEEANMIIRVIFKNDRTFHEQFSNTVDVCDDLWHDTDQEQAQMAAVPLLKAEDKEHPCCRLAQTVECCCKGTTVGLGEDQEA